MHADTSLSYKAAIAEMQREVICKGLDYSQIHVARLESEWSLAYRQEPSVFVADKWFPLMPVKQISGLYPRFSKENLFTNRAGLWRPGTVPPQAELSVDQPGSYVCQRYAFEMPLPSDLPFVADEGYPIEMATTQMITDVLQLNKELIIANNYFKPGVWSIDWSGVDSGESGTGEQVTDLTFRQFNDFQNSDPLEVFKDAKMAIKKRCGVKPNTIVMSEQVYEVLRIHPQLTNLFRNPQAADRVPVKLNEQMVATALDVDQLFVAGAMYNKSPPGKEVELDWVFGNGVWVGYVTTPGPLKTIAAMNLTYNEPLGGYDTALVQVPDLHTHTTYFQGFQCWCPVVVSPDAGLFMADAISVGESQ